MATTDEVAENNRETVQGDCFTVAVTYKDSDGAAIDLTGYDAELGAADQHGTSHWIGDNSSTVAGPGAGTVDIDGPAGTITGTVPKDITGDWEVGKKSAKYQLTIITPSGCRKTLLVGDIEVHYSPVLVAEA